MGLASCVVRLLDTTPNQDPVAGVVVRFYDSGETFVTQETTDVDGEVDVLLDGSASPGTTYHVRAYKLGCSFGGPWEIQVMDPLPTPPPTVLNDWTMDVDIFEVASSPTPGMCRVSGYVRKVDGTLLTPANVQFHLYQTPRVFYGSLVAGDVTANGSTGYIQIDLIREGEYEVVIPGWLETSRKVLVPDRAGILLADLLFPIPISLTWPLGTSITVHVGETVEVTPELLGTDYNDWGMGGDYMLYAITDESIASVYRGAEMMEVTGTQVGSTTLVATRTDACFRVVPERSLLNGVVTIDVIP